MSGCGRRITTALQGEVICDECDTAFDAERCPTCAQRRRRRAGLEAVVETFGNDRRYVVVERSDEDDGAGWWPTENRRLDQDGDEPEGWPW